MLGTCHFEELASEWVFSSIAWSFAVWGGMNLKISILAEKGGGYRPGSLPRFRGAGKTKPQLTVEI
jgi:hypothetical protein